MSNQVAMKCGCVVIRDSREHDECVCDSNGENWICGECYDGEECKCGNMNLDDEDEGIPNTCKKCSGRWCYDCGGDDLCDDCNSDLDDDDDDEEEE